MILSCRERCRQGTCFLLLVIAAIGCGGTSNKPQVPSQTEGLVPADRSLVVGEYMKAGIPTASKPWSAKEMAATAKGLAALAEKDPNNLPRFESERSGLLF